MNRHVKMGPGKEFDAVRSLLDGWGSAAVGIGDDGAVLDVPSGSRLVVSTDSTVEDIHFRPGWLEPDEIGYRATMAALSDLAAMGARPLGVLLALTVPEQWRDRLPAIANGIGKAAVLAEAPIVGGDVTDGARLTLAITVLGHSPSPMSRTGAVPGDRIYVTGELGGPRGALLSWEAGGEPLAADRARFASPTARIAAGQWLALNGVTAAIDLSDGLAGDARHLATASGVCCVIQVDSVPTLGDHTVEHALVSGEEYELLVTAPGLDLKAFAAHNPGVTITEIGYVGEICEGDVIGERGGERFKLSGAYDQFADK